CSFRGDAEDGCAGGGRAARGAQARSVAARHEGARRSAPDQAPQRRDHACGSVQDRALRYPPLRQAPVHLVPASAAGVFLVDAGAGERMAWLRRFAAQLSEPRSGPIGAFFASAANSLSRFRQDPAKLIKSGSPTCPLTLGTRPVWFAQSLENLKGTMRNIITKILIVVPRRAAGDG